MSDLRIVHVITLEDRHFDPVATVHESEEGAELRVAKIKQDYAEHMFGSEWRWNERAKLWQSYDDGPAIRVERKELQP